MGIDLRVVLGHTLAFSPDDDLREQLDATLDLRAAADSLIDIVENLNPRATYLAERYMRFPPRVGRLGWLIRPSWKRALAIARRTGQVAPPLRWAGAHIHWGPHAVQLTFMEALRAFLRQRQLREAIRNASRVFARAIRGPDAAIYVPDSTYDASIAGSWAEREGLTFEQIATRLEDRHGPPSTFDNYRDGGWLLDDFKAS